MSHQQWYETVALQELWESELPNLKQPVMPSVGILEGAPYTPAAHTDVRTTWRKHGWKPIHEHDPE